MSLSLSVVPLAELEHERQSHFSRLGEGPELYLELLLRTGTAHPSLEHREGVFESPEEVDEWVDRGHVSVLERAATFLGIGLLTPVWSSRREYDVGVMVHPEHRHHGYATYILRSLKRRCLDLGMRPTAGCALENVASSRALTRAGFISQHALLIFQSR